MHPAFDICSRELQTLGREYYYQQLSLEEYRARRKQLFDQLEQELRPASEGDMRPSSPDSDSVTMPAD